MSTTLRDALESGWKPPVSDSPPVSKLEIEMFTLCLRLRDYLEIFGTLTDHSKITRQGADAVLMVDSGTIRLMRWCVEQNVFKDVRLRKPHGFKVVSFLIALQHACQLEMEQTERTNDAMVAEIIAGTWKRLISELGEQGAKDKMRTLYADAIQRDETGWLKQILNQSFKIATT